jgi:CRISPR-associated protein Cmr5
MIQNINNDRAKDAYEYIEKNIKDEKELQKEFRTLARSFPTMVQVNGTCAAVAFLYAKKQSKTSSGSLKNSAHGKLLETLENWLRIKGFIGVEVSLMKSLTSCSSEEYRLISKEIIAYTQWLKRFAEGMLEI